MPKLISVRSVRSLALPLLLLAAACARPVPPTAAPPAASTATPTVAPTVAPAATVAPAPTPTPAQAAATTAPTVAPDWTQVAVQEGDYYVLGNPSATVRLTDYSDFL
jgi:hypothetical protein